MPAVTVVTPSDLVTDRSPWGCSWSVSVAVLLFGFGSTAPAGIVTAAVLVTVPVADGSTVAVRRNVAVPPLSKSTVVLMLPVLLANEHLEPLEAVQVQEGFNNTAGTVSATCTPNTSFGPLLRTTIV